MDLLFKTHTGREIIIPFKKMTLLTAILFHPFWGKICQHKCQAQPVKMIKCASLDHKWVYHVSSPHFVMHIPSIIQCVLSGPGTGKFWLSQMGAGSPWHGAEEGSFGRLWLHGLQRSVVTLPDSGSKDCTLWQSTVQGRSSCSHNSPLLCLSKAPALGSPPVLVAWSSAERAEGRLWGCPTLMHSSLSAEEWPFLRGLRLPLGLPST